MKAVVVDGNNLAYGIYSRVKESRNGLLHSSTGIPTTVIFGMMRSLYAFTKNVGEVDRVIIAWDTGGGSAMRKSIFPQYKGNRKYVAMDDYFAELNAAREYLPYFGIASAPCKGIEADDAIGYYAGRYLEQGYRVIIYSNDKDFFQLTRENRRLHLWRPIKDEMLDYTEVCGVVGHDPRWLPKLQGLVGQQKDNIPGACDLDDEGKMKKFGFGEAKAKKLMFNEDGECRTFKEMLHLLNNDSPCSGPHTAQLLKNWEQVKISYTLSKIRMNPGQYSAEELVSLESAFEEAVATQEREYKVKDWALHAEMLDIKSIPVATISRALGAKVKGKEKVDPKRKRGRIKVTT